MKWVKFSERKPELDKNYYIKTPEDSRSHMFYYKMSESVVLQTDHNCIEEKDLYDYYWLDESPTQSQGNEQGEGKLYTREDMQKSFNEGVESASLYREPDTFEIEKYFPDPVPKKLLRSPTPQTESECGGDIERIVKTWVNDSADWAEAMRDLEKEVGKLNENTRILRSNCQIHTNSIQTLQQHLREKEAQLQALQSSNDKLVEALKKLIRQIEIHGGNRISTFECHELLSSIPDNKPGE